MRAEDFLREYRVLEQLLEAKYARAARTNSSVVMEFLRDEDSAPVRERLNICREIRNLLTHTAAPDGEPFVEPAEEAMRMLNAVLAFVREPLRAVEFATPVDKLLFARPDYFALRTMRAMDERGFSHVPVLENGRFAGVFSVSTVFSYLLSHPGEAICDTTRIRLFQRFLPVDKHRGEKFVFMDGSATYLDVKSAFERGSKKRHRIAAIFLTENGARDSVLLGMITPLDILGKVQGEGTLIE